MYTFPRLPFRDNLVRKDWDISQNAITKNDSLALMNDTTKDQLSTFHTKYQFKYDEETHSTPTNLFPLNNTIRMIFLFY